MKPPGKDWPPMKGPPASTALDPATKDMSQGTDSGSSAEGTSAGASADPLLEMLRALPSLSPDDALSARVTDAGLAVLSAKKAAKPTAKPSERQQAESAPGWRSYLEFALYRAALPSALAGATVIYLSWAISAASHLY